MKKIFKKTALLLCLLSFSISSFAYIEICFPSGDCYITEGSCDGWCPNPPAAPTCTQGFHVFDPIKDAINYTNRQFWVGSDTKKYRIASDNMVKFIKSMNLKYKNSNLNSGKVVAAIQKEYTEFLKNDDGIVSPKRLAILQKETNLKFVDKDNISTPTEKTVDCPSGTYPNGLNCYPCLGCHPCGGSYCDNNTNKTISIKITDLEPVNLINEFEAGGGISTKITQKNLVRLVLENSTKENVGTNSKPKVKCGCGTSVYGKDAAACDRICDFLGSSGVKY